jgi:hypothetical protein
LRTTFRFPNAVSLLRLRHLDFLVNRERGPALLDGAEGVAVILKREFPLITAV